MYSTEMLSDVNVLHTMRNNSELHGKFAKKWKNSDCIRNVALILSKRVVWWYNNSGPGASGHFKSRKKVYIIETNVYES